MYFILSMEWMECGVKGKLEGGIGKRGEIGNCNSYVKWKKKHLFKEIKERSKFQFSHLHYEEVRLNVIQCPKEPKNSKSI